MRALFALTIAALLLAAAAPARAQDEDQQIALAMENYQLGDHAAARAALVASIGRLEAAGQGKSPAAARAHLMLGVVFALGLRDRAEAAEQFTAALAIDPALALDADYATGAAAELFAQAKAEAGKPPPPPPPPPEAAVDCASLEGIAHESVDSADAGAPRRIECEVGDGLRAAAVTLHYRKGEGGSFAAEPMKRAAGCRYAAEVPADALVPGAVVEYYITAETAAGRPAASKGSAQSPFLMEVSAVVEDVGVGGEGEEDEIPKGLSGQPPKPRGGGCAGCAVGGGDEPAAWLAGLTVLAALGLLSWPRRRRPDRRPSRSP